MPTWSGILAELNQAKTEDGKIDFDGVRRKYLAALHQYTHRDTVLYATKWTQPDLNVSPDVISVVEEDLQGLMEVIHGLKGPYLDLILHSPGGSIEAAEGFVTYLRSKFSHIRVVVPHLAMSAATMIACASNVIVLGKHSFLGPIDPQLIINTPLGIRMVPAQAILAQFDWAVGECSDPSKLPAWLPMLNQFGPDLLVQCEDVSRLSYELVRKWLKEYMFRTNPKRAYKATSIAKWLSNHAEFKTHGRHIPREELEARGLTTEHLEADQKVQDLVLSAFHATTHTFNGTTAVKIIENHVGRAFIKTARPLLVPVEQPKEK